MRRLGSPGTFEFRPVRQIGAGGLGTVEEVEITRTYASHPVGSRLALKRLGSKWAAHPEARERFDKEIEAVQRMSHPNIISCQGENLEGNPTRFYLMPLCQRSYRQVLVDNGAGFEWSSVATLGAQLADALHYAHSCGFVHRDLKPENILLDRLNNALIADWGVGYFVHQHSKVLDPAAVADPMATSYYCALEQWATGRSGPSGDVYSLGMMLAELVWGHRIPLTVIGLGIQQDVVSPTTAGARAFNDTIRRMTIMVSARRIQDMTRVAAELRQSVATGRFEW